MNERYFIVKDYCVSVIFESSLFPITIHVRNPTLCLQNFELINQRCIIIIGNHIYVL